jgi:hypothetical protein
MALWVNETTLLPVLVPLVPTATLFARFTAALGDVLAAHNAAAGYVTPEASEMDQFRLAKTANRGVVGIMNEFIFLADTYTEGIDQPNLHALSLRLAETPCGPLYKRHISPDRELAALLAQHPTT